MAVTDGVKIAAIVAAPIIFFALLFGLAIWYRRCRGGKMVKHPEWGIISPQRHRLSSHCGQCSEKHCLPTTGPSDSSKLIARHSGLSGSGGVDPHLGEGDSSADQRGLVTQPHFAETTTIIRRLSASKQDDTVQRINSILSTLCPDPDRSAEDLALGGRKSSVGLIYPVGLGDSGRRPSVLNDESIGILDVRRVSAGGAEDTVRVRSASQSSSTNGPRAALGSPSFDKGQSDSPTLSPSHPFSAASLSRTSNIHTGSFTLHPPPTLARTPARTSASLNGVHAPATSATYLTPLPPASGGSMEALKSPPQTAFSDDSEVTSTEFITWRGFTAGLPDKGAIGGGQRDTDEAISPKTPRAAANYQDDIGPRQDEIVTLAFPIPQPTGTPPISDTTVPQMILGVPTSTLTHDGLAEAKQPAIDFSVTPAHSPERPLSFGPEAKNDLTPVGPAEGKRESKITYLADVVRENEQRQKETQEGGSSNVAKGRLNKGDPPWK